MSGADLKQEILDKVKEYYVQNRADQPEFEPGRTFVNYGGRYFDEKELVNLVDSSLDFWLTAGPWAHKFEKRFSEWLGVKYCSLTNSGSSANLLALMALTSSRLGERRIKKGDEVIKVIQNTIQRIVSDTDFDEEVELVISDNCSTDEIEEIVTEFSKKYANVFYYKNETNIKEKNFSKVLSYGNGAYLKLQNDYCGFSVGSLKFIKEKIKENIENKIPLFFTGNGIYTKRKNDIIYCSSLDDYIQTISTFTTYISCFGAWKEQFTMLPDKDRCTDLLLAQNDWHYRIMSIYKKCTIFDQAIYVLSPSPLGVRKGYNWFKVHIDNYYTIMQLYIACGEISKNTYYEDRKYALSHFRRQLFYIYVYKIDKNFGYDTSGTFSIFWRYYKDIPLFYFYLFLCPFCFLPAPFTFSVRILLKNPSIYSFAGTIYRFIKKKNDK